jgi:hypothetical protein
MNIHLNFECFAMEILLESGAFDMGKLKIDEKIEISHSLNHLLDFEMFGLIHLILRKLFDMVMKMNEIAH